MIIAILLNQFFQLLLRKKNILFGSRARGDYNEESDLDLMIIDPNPFGKGRSRLKEKIKIREALKDISIAKDILLYDKNEVEFWKDSINHIISNCLQEGKILYERH